MESSTSSHLSSTSSSALQSLTPKVPPPTSPSPSTTSMSLEAVAIITRTNTLLCLRNYSSEGQSDADLESLFYLATKYFDDQATSKPNEQFLGAVFSLENSLFYGWCTQSRTRIMALVRWAERQPKETTMRQLMSRLNQANWQLMANPFYRPEVPTTSERFLSTLDQIKASL